MADDTPNVLTVPMNPDGTIGTLPEPLQKFLDAKIAQVAKRQDAKAAPLPDPVERERLRQLEQENQQFKVSEAEREKRYEEALKMREDDWSRKYKDAESAIEKRTQRIVQLVGAEVRAAAVRHGARDESLEDIEALLNRRIAINDNLDAVVLDAKGEPTDQSIEDLVKATLDSKPYFRRPPATGGGARGGMSLAGAAPNPKQQIAEAAAARIQRDRNDLDAINALFEATRAKQSA